MDQGTMLARGPAARRRVYSHCWAAAWVAACLGCGSLRAQVAEPPEPELAADFEDLSLEELLEVRCGIIGIQIDVALDDRAEGVRLPRIVFSAACATTRWSNSPARVSRASKSWWP